VRALQGGPAVTGPSTLRAEVQLEQPLRTVQATGEAVLAFVSAGPVFAAVRQLSLREIAVGGRNDGVATHEIRIRYRSDVVGGWQIRWGERLFRILAAGDPDGRGVWLRCLAEEEGR